MSMTLIARERIAPQEFEQFVELPENASRLFELIDEEIVEKVPTNPYSSAVAARLVRFIDTFSDANDLGDGGDVLSGFALRVGDIFPD